jgi:RND family efflux transporter MFP subunit
LIEELSLMNRAPYIRWPWLTLLLGPLCLSLLTGCGGKAASEQAADEDNGAAHVVAMQARQVKFGRWVTLAGGTQPLLNHTARVSNAVEGRVVDVLPVDENGKRFAEGDWVKKGQLIARLDTQVAQAGQARAEADLKDAQAQIQTARTAVQLATQTLNRLEALQRTEQPGRPLVPPAQLQQARGDWENAQSQEKAANAKEASARAALTAIEKQLAYYDLRAPIDGYLSTVQAVPGQMLALGTPVAEVMNLNEIDVLCYAPPSQVNLLRIGQPAQVVGSDTSRLTLPSPPSDGGEGRVGRAQGKVVYIAVQAQPDSGSFAVKVRFPNPDLALRANALVQVHVEVEPARERLAIPVSALIDDTRPPQVVLAQLEEKKEEDEGKPEAAKEPEKAPELEKKVWVAHRYEAIVGARDRKTGMVEIVALHGLEEKDEPPPLQDAWFVTSGWHGVKPGDQLEVEKVEPNKEKK